MLLKMEIFLWTIHGSIVKILYFPKLCIVHAQTRSILCKSVFYLLFCRKVCSQSHRYIYYNSRFHWFKKIFPTSYRFFFYLLAVVLGPQPARLCYFNRLCDVLGDVLMCFLVLLSIIYIICWSFLFPLYFNCFYLFFYR